ncbi:MAG: response regulator transcription factor [Flavobacteriaceae bacterium]|nr:response regulator transcription factor [Flavobacteriaceae bacterium]
MKKKLYILIVDDHPVIVEAYKNILSSADLNGYDFTIDTAYDCDGAIRRIDNSVKNIHYDVLFFDIKLPASTCRQIISGEDLAVHARKKLPLAKVVILTMFNENHRIHNILKTVNPDGLLIKNDLTSREFIRAFDIILNNPPYYSTTVAKYFRKQALNFENSLLDDVNRKIVYHLSRGVKTKNLTQHINLSLSAIEKRKIQIKNLLQLENAKDEELIKEAKKRGFI